MIFQNNDTGIWTTLRLFTSIDFDFGTWEVRIEYSLRACPLFTALSWMSTRPRITDISTISLGDGWVSRDPFHHFGFGSATKEGCTLLPDRSLTPQIPLCKGANRGRLHGWTCHEDYT